MFPLKNLGFKSLNNLNLGQKTTLMTAAVLVLGVAVFSHLRILTTSSRRIVGGSDQPGDHRPEGRDRHTGTQL